MAGYSLFIRGLCSLITIAVTGVQAQNGRNGVTFLYPTAGLTFYHLDTIEVSYISPFPNPLLYTFCNSGRRQIRVQEVEPFNATALAYLNFTSATPCYFNLRPNTSVGFGANGEPFTLINTERSPTTLGLSSTSSASTATSTSNPSSSTSSAATTSASSSGLSSGAKIGIGVGVSLGAILLIAAIVGFCCMRRRKNKSGVTDQQQQPAHPTQQPSGYEEAPKFVAGDQAHPDPYHYQFQDQNQHQHQQYPPQQQQPQMAQYHELASDEQRTQELPAYR
ncbi:hypothetical protein PVAG01_00700 [Phlyctema vagabunda]|uniref:Uncharacterized protein n=1 Tax=Phlyctema vagabunda TaxID=108571 RepID=A0ABR4PWE1_9HELO